MTKQINNLKIRWSRIYDRFQVVAPDGAVLEEFDHFEQAVKCAESIKDFLKK